MSKETYYIVSKETYYIVLCISLAVSYYRVAQGKLW